MTTVPVPADATVVAPRTAGTHVMCGLVALGGAVALVRGHLGATTSNGRLTVDLLMGTFTVLAVAGWAYLILRPMSLVVGNELITLVARNGSTAAQLHRSDGGLYLRITGSARYRSLALCATDTATMLSIPGFHRQDVRDACVAHAWPWVPAAAR